VNAAWRRFGRERLNEEIWLDVGDDYRAMWRKGADAIPDAAAMLAGLEEVLSGGRATFEVECPWDSVERRWFRVYGSAVRFPFEPGAVLMHVDVTEQRRAVQNLRQLSKAAVAAENAYRQWLNHAFRQDALTGLDSRSVLERAARWAIARSAGKSGVCALMLIDL